MAFGWSLCVAVLFLSLEIVLIHANSEAASQYAPPMHHMSVRRCASWDAFVSVDGILHCATKFITSLIVSRGLLGERYQFQGFLKIDDFTYTLEFGKLLYSRGDALYALRRSLVDPENVLQSWDPTLVNPCTWFHVTCNSQNQVTRVDLGNVNLSGSLVPELGNLQHLKYLELYKNNLKGRIPEELGKLKYLVSLDLYMNNFTGQIPRSLGKLKSLVFLRLNHNQLTGKIPRELTTISSLKVVDVSNNNLCGTIPISGSFSGFPVKNFESNPRLDGPELQGFVPYETSCE